MIISSWLSVQRCVVLSVTVRRGVSCRFPLMQQHKQPLACVCVCVCLPWFTLLLFRLFVQSIIDAEMDKLFHVLWDEPFRMVYTGWMHEVKGGPKTLVRANVRFLYR
jgi:hypothetical protein